jgi:hypothetical protein
VFSICSLLGTDDYSSGKPVRVFESANIVLYLAEKYAPSFIPHEHRTGLSNVCDVVSFCLTAWFLPCRNPQLGLLVARCGSLSWWHVWPFFRIRAGEH